MKTITKYINEGILNEGFFNNVGADYVDIILEWLITLEGYISTQSRNYFLNRCSVRDISPYFTLIDNKFTSNKSPKLSIKIHPKDIDTMPDTLYFGNGIILSITFIDFKRSDFSKLEKIKDRLPDNIEFINIAQSDLKNLEFLKGVSSVHKVHIQSSKIDSFKGIENVNIYNLTLNDISGPDKGDFLKEVPTITHMITISRCSDINDISGISENNRSIDKLFIYKNSNLRKCNLSKFNKIYEIIGDNNLLVMTKYISHLPKKLSIITFDIDKGYIYSDKVKKSKELLKSKFPEILINI